MEQTTPSGLILVSAENPPPESPITELQRIMQMASDADREHIADYYRAAWGTPDLAADEVFAKLADSRRQRFGPDWK